MNEELKFMDEKVKLVEVVGTILKSRTQSIKVLVIEKDGEKFVSIQKWWKKAPEDAWSEGKGFHFNHDETVHIGQYLDSAKQIANFA